MPGIPYASPAIGMESESVFFGSSRHKDYWQQQAAATDSPRRVPLVPLRNYSAEVQAARSNSKSRSRIAVHDPSAVLMKSSDSENDLAAMVHDFIENGEGGHDGYDSSDKESTAARGFAVSFEKLKATLSIASTVEKELRSAVTRILLAMSEDRIDGFCHREIYCKGRCLRSFLVKRLRKAGYDAGICKSRWQSVGRVPGGEYEYIDVETNNERFIVDVDFHSHFEIARPIQQYKAAVRILPTPFVGTCAKLTQVLQVMSDAAKFSLKQNSMHLPPWRTFDYMSAKWLSPFDRESPGRVGSRGFDRPAAPTSDDNALLVVVDRVGCADQLKRTKACLAIRQEMDRAVAAPQAQARSRHREVAAAAATAPASAAVAEYHQR